MRIVAGRLRGRRIEGPRGGGVRPTSDRLRETLFNVLGQRLDAIRVLDAFAGTGALGLEALSRGAAEVTFVERDRAALDVIEGNVAACQAGAACAVIRADFLRRDDPRFARLTDRGPFDLVLLDPPYDLEDLTAVLSGADALLAPGGRVVLEHSRRRESPQAVGSLVRTRVLPVGDGAISFYTSGR